MNPKLRRTEILTDFLALARWSPFQEPCSLRDAAPLPSATGSRCFFRSGGCFQSRKQHRIFSFSKVQAEAVVLPILGHHSVGVCIFRGEPRLPKPVVPDIDEVRRSQRLRDKRWILKPPQVQWFGHEGGHVTPCLFQFLCRGATPRLLRLKAEARNVERGAENDFRRRRCRVDLWGVPYAK